MKNTLDKMILDQKAIVSNVGSDLKMARRFLDIGLTEGTVVECVLISYGGEMKAYVIKGAVIAIRKEDANLIKIEYC